MRNLWHIFGVFVLIAGILDALKYSFLSRKVKRLGSSRGISRQFNNVAVLHKVVLFIWASFYLKDWIVAFSTFIALFTSVELWILTFKNYPFQGRGRFGYKRPSTFKYFINSITPNKYTRKI